MKRIFIYAVAAMATISLAACGQNTNKKADDAAKGETATEETAPSALELTAEGQPFSDFEIVQDPENPEASTVKLSDYVGKGKYILADFWASWCGPCKQEIPNIKNVWEKYHGEDFDVLSIAVWDEIEDTKAAAKEHGIAWLQIINGQKIPTDVYGIEGIPQIMLFGPDGIILKRNLRGGAIEAEVAKYVKEK